MHRSVVAIFRLAGAAGSMLALSCLPALADAIDGKWCRSDGRRLEIAGPRITTPGGTVMDGDYTRHTFRYRVPDGEEFGGTTRFLQLRGEDWMHAVPADQAGAQPEVWERCRLVS